MGESFAERRRRELGLDSPSSSPDKSSSSSSGSSFVERRKIELGLVERPTAMQTGQRINGPVEMDEISISTPHIGGPVEMDEEPKNSPTYSEYLRGITPSFQEIKDVFSIDNLKNAGKELISRLGRPSQVIAEYATPNAPLIGDLPNGEYGEIPGTNARQAFLERTGQQPATGFGEKALGMIASPFVVPGAGLGTGAALTKAIEQDLMRISPKFAESLGGRVVQGAAVGAPLGAGMEMAQGTGDTEDVLTGAGFGAGLGVLGPLVGSGINKLRGVAKNAATGLSENVLKNAVENSRSSVVSPFMQGVEGNPIAKGYTENVGRTFGNGPSRVFEESTTPDVIPTSRNGGAASNIDSSVSRPLSAPVRQQNPQTTTRSNTLTQVPTDELQFAQTVRNSEHTAPELTAAMNERPMVGARTSDVLNRQQAQDLITKHGVEGLYGKLMGKTKGFSASENTAAQMLSKHYSSLGGEENLSKAIDLVSKTAKGGREMGQAIQALSQWNKLDAEGALLVAEKQLNRGIKDTADWQKLTVTQATPIKEAAQRIGSAQETKSLADEVLNIVTNKQAGEALTDAEKATIKQFQDQVKLINAKGKGILSPAVRGSKANAIIKEVSQIEPKARTRDQVVSFFDAKAEKARQRLASSRNIGFAAINQSNPIVDYSIIGASHIAKGVVKLADFTEAMVRDFGESVRPHINEVFTKATRMFRKENGLPTVEELDRVVSQAVSDKRFTPEDAKRLKAWASEIGHMSNEFKVEATQDLQKAMKELGDSTLGQKIATVQTGAQLLNAVTVGRNVIGNAALITAEKLNKLSAVPIDYALSKITGERTIKFLPKVQEHMWRNFLKGTGAGWEGISPTGTLDSYGIHPNVFGKKNPLKYITKSLGASMQGFDFAAYRAAYGDVLATYGEQLGKAQGLTKSQIKEQMPKLIESLDSRIHDLADEAGRYATFQDDTLLSRGVEMLKKGLNKPTDMLSQALVEKGMPKKYSLEGFGAGDLVLKYAKTPANLVMRALDYSPVGFLRSAMELAPLAYNRGKFNQFQATRSLSRAITGTLGLTGMGYILADAGVLTGSSSMDKDTRSIQEQSGQGAYKVNWSALNRFITSGFDKSAAQYQKGDHLTDYAWLQPAAISIAMGVNANKSLKDRKNGSDVAGWKVAEKALLGGLQTVLENPMVQGMSGVIDAANDIVKRQDPTKLINIGKGAPATFVPTVLNQLRTATDNKQRETYSKNLLTEMGNIMANKVPGLSNNLPISYDSLGNKRERIQGGQEGSVAQYLTAFFSPAKLTEYQVSPEAKLVLDLMNESGDQNVLPRIADRYIKVSQGKNEKDLRVDLTAKEYSQLQQRVGQMVTDKLKSQATYLSDPKKSLDSKVKRVKDILTDTGQKARDEIGTQMGYAKKDVR